MDTYVKVSGLMLEHISRIYHAPGDWLVHHTNARDRRSFGFWTFVISLALAPIFGNKVYFVTGLSLLALIPNFSAETPVEGEDESS